MALLSNRDLAIILADVEGLSLKVALYCVNITFNYIRRSVQKGIRVEYPRFGKWRRTEPKILRYWDEKHRQWKYAYPRKNILFTPFKTYSRRINGGKLSEMLPIEQDFLIERD